MAIQMENELELEQVHREMFRYKIGILALQEIRWKGEGIINKKLLVLVYYNYKF